MLSLRSTPKVYCLQIRTQSIPALKEDAFGLMHNPSEPCTTASDVALSYQEVHSGFL